MRGIISGTQFLQGEICGGNLQGVISAQQTLHGEIYSAEIQGAFNGLAKLNGEIHDAEEMIGLMAADKVLQGTVSKMVDANDYSGTYEVTPTSYEQQLQTANKRLYQNVIVHKTPYYETSNVEGGYTATIL